MGSYAACGGNPYWRFKKLIGPIFKGQEVQED